MSDAFRNAHVALAFLESHRLPPTASNYAFAVEVANDPDGALAGAVARETDGGLRLTIRSLTELSERFLHGRSATAADRESDVRRHATELGSLTLDAQTLTKTLSDDVSAMAVQARDWPDSYALVNRLSDAERELASLRKDVADLQASLVSLADRRDDPTRDHATQALTIEGAQPLFDRLSVENRAYVLLLFSVNNLNIINSRFGYSVGDNVVSAFVANLRQVFHDDQVIRWTGNEFVIISTEIALTKARVLAEEVLEAFAKRRLKLRGSGELIGTVTASAACVVGQGSDQVATLMQARAKLYQAPVEGAVQIDA